MSTMPTVPMFPPGSNEAVDVPYDQMHDMISQHGGELGVDMTGPDGEIHTLPASRVKDGLAQGGKIMPYNFDKPQSWWDITKSAASNLGSNIVNALPHGWSNGNNPVQQSAMPLTPLSNAMQTDASVMQNSAQQGHGTAYQLAAGEAANAGANVTAAEASAKQGDVGGVIGNLAMPLAAIAAGEAAPGMMRALGRGVRNQVEAASAMHEGAPEAPVTTDVQRTAAATQPEATKAPGLIQKPAALKSLDELAGTTPQRLQELQKFPQRVDAIRQSVLDAEDKAHTAASAKFPDIKEPIDTGMKDENGEPVMTTFRRLQEQRSTLLADINEETRQINAGQKPAYDRARMQTRLNGVDNMMTKAAQDNGVLHQLQDARASFKQYMDDFHNPGSPLKKVLDSQPGDTAKIIQQFNNPRAIETLQRNGADVTDLRNILTEGSRAVKVNVAESGKMRKAGSPEAYRTQRLKESLSQATNNELPSGAEARLPAQAMKSSVNSAVRNVPGSSLLSNRNITRARLSNALSKQK